MEVCFLIPTLSSTLFRFLCVAAVIKALFGGENVNSGVLEQTGEFPEPSLKSGEGAAPLEHPLESWKMLQKGLLLSKQSIYGVWGEEGCALDWILYWGFRWDTGKEFCGKEFCVNGVDCAADKRKRTEAGKPFLV